MQKIIAKEATDAGAAPPSQQRLAVHISEPNREPRRGHLLLPQTVDLSVPARAIEEFLNQLRTFVAFAEPDGRVSLLVRANIEWVAVGHASGSQPEPTVPPQEVEARFMDERRVDGAIVWQPSPELPQLVDYLNAQGEFFTMLSPVGPLIVNRHRLRELRLASARGV